MFWRNNNTFLIIILIMLVFNLMSGSFDIMGTLLMLPGLILALTFHEYAHAKMSDRLGDPTPEAQGRLTLNPLMHMDIMGTICLLFAGFGWGKAVEVNPTYYRNPARDSMLVAAAGPIINFILAFILFIVLAFISIFGDFTSELIEILYTMVLYGAYLNISLGVFNLLPFPPLDGSKIFRYFLKGKAKDFLYTLEQYSWIIIIILFITEIPSIIITPVVDWIANAMLWIIITIINFIVKIF